MRLGLGLGPDKLCFFFTYYSILILENVPIILIKNPIIL